MPSKPLKILGNSQQMERLESAWPCLRYIRASFEAWGYIYDSINVFGRRLQWAWIHSKEAKLQDWITGSGTQRDMHTHAYAHLIMIQHCDNLFFTWHQRQFERTYWDASSQRHSNVKYFSVENSECLTAHLVRNVQLIYLSFTSQCHYQYYKSDILYSKYNKLLSITSCYCTNRL